MKFAITGANGQVGSFLVAFLRNHGHVVYELVRSADRTIDKQYYKFFDLSQPEKMPSLQDIDVLIHAAYFFDTTDKNYEKINIDGTQKLFQQAKSDFVKYSIFISTLSSHADATSLYGRTKYQLEKLLKSQNVAIIRPGLIFHNSLQGITAAMDKFVAKLPLVPLIGTGKQLIYPCFLEQLAELLLVLSIKQPLLNQPVIASTEKPITFKQLVKYLAKQRQKIVLLLPIPFYGIYYLLKFFEILRFRIGLRSDSLLGIQYACNNLDFSETRKLKVEFSTLGI